MADRSGSHRQDGLRAISARFAAVRLVLIVALALAAVAVVVFAVPPVAAILGFLALSLALFLSTAGYKNEAGMTVRSAKVRQLWPDLSMKMVAEALDDPCFITDPAGIARFQNKAATLRFGPPRPGDPLSFKLRVPELLTAVERTGRGEEVEPIRFFERVPTERFYTASVRPLRGLYHEERARIDFVLVILRDETDLMRMERMRGDFIANASHELRTPLASLTGFVETLLGAARHDEANRERFLKIMLEQAQRMARLIDDLLSLSRIEMKLHVRPDTPVDFAALVGYVADIMGPLAKENKTRLASVLPGNPVMVRGDRDELIQVITNLVENAIKYGGENGTVDIALTLERRGEGAESCTLSVRDHGPGIAPEHLPRLTERFYRVDSDDRPKQKGTGLGLAIVKHIVNRHGGRLAIRSKPGEGALFQVSLDVIKGNEMVEN